MKGMEEGEMEQPWPYRSRGAVIFSFAAGKGVWRAAEWNGRGCPEWRPEPSCCGLTGRAKPIKWMRNEGMTWGGRPWQMALIMAVFKALHHKKGGGDLWLSGSRGRAGWCGWRLNIMCLYNGDRASAWPGIAGRMQAGRRLYKITLCL